jgi:hypothetical protein
VAGGDTIIFRDGVYQGTTYTSIEFDDWVTIRAEHPYQAKLTNLDPGGYVWLSVGATRVIIEDLVISNAHPSYVCGGSETDYLVHFQDSRHVIFRNNIVFGNNSPGTCNEVLKINRGGTTHYPRDILISGNVIYDAPDVGGASLIDVRGVGEVDILENIFFSRNSPGCGAWIYFASDVDLSTEEHDVTPRSPRHMIARNIFLNIGEAYDDEHDIHDILVENNLLIGNSATELIAPFQARSFLGLVIRANTIAGDLPGGAYAVNVFYEGHVVPKKDLFILNNIWSDPTGSMGDRFLEYLPDRIDPLEVNIVLDNNLYYNGGGDLPSTQSPAPADDPDQVVGDPLLADHADLILPVWEEEFNRFRSGSLTIREEFERLVNQYGAIAEGSPAIGQADPANMPATDIRGLPRDENPDIGAFEFEDEVVVQHSLVLRAGTAIAPDTVVRAGSPAVVLRLELDSMNVSGSLNRLRVAFPGLEKMHSTWYRVLVELYSDPDGDDQVNIGDPPYGAVWLEHGVATLEGMGLDFGPDGQDRWLVQLTVVETGAIGRGDPGSGFGLGWLGACLLGLLMTCVRRRPVGVRWAAAALLIVGLLACSRYGFELTMFQGRAVVESQADVGVTSEPSSMLQLENTPIEGDAFEIDFSS